MKVRNTLLAAAVALVAGVSFQASAAETSSTFQVTATVASSCAIMGAANLEFDSYNPVSTNATAALLGFSSGIQVRCNGGTTAKVQLDEGLNKAAGSTCSAPNRAMVNGTGDRLSYQLASNGSISDIWGCASDTEETLTFTTLETKNQMVFGEIPAGQAVPVGSYADTVTVKVLF